MGGPTPGTMALMYTKGFASFSEKGNNEQKLFLRVLGTGVHHQPWGKKRKSKGQNQCSDVEPSCTTVGFSGYVLENTTLEENDKVSRFYQNSPVNV